MKAWAKIVNKAGGVAGRKVVIDFIDSKLNPNETRNAIITACANDFAMVGGEALFLSNVDDMVACKNKAGEAIGLPDMPGNALDTTQSCSPVTYLGHRPRQVLRRPRTSTRRPTRVQQGDYLLLPEAEQGPARHLDGPRRPEGHQERGAADRATRGSILGIKKDGDGFYDIFSRDPQSAMTPIVQDDQAEQLDLRRQNGGNKMADLRKEATLQGVTSVKVWACNQACYDNLLIEQGGADVERHADRAHRRCPSTPSTRATRR